MLLRRKTRQRRAREQESKRARGRAICTLHIVEEDECCCLGGREELTGRKRFVVEGCICAVD